MPIGAGGMGEVYRARDTRLNREVAVKVLPGDLLEGEKRKTRFEREARMLASLNHPGIAAIHSFEEIPGPSPSSSRHLLVMELFEGESLDQRISRGPLPLEESQRDSSKVPEVRRALPAARHRRCAAGPRGARCADFARERRRRNPGRSPIPLRRTASRARLHCRSQRFGDPLYWVPAREEKPVSATKLSEELKHRTRTSGRTSGRRTASGTGPEVMQTSQ
ncbi:MAG: protein kinase domain-containing protein [Acidithiobacillales bacterium]